jgi:predicted RecB family nuclease
MFFATDITNYLACQHIATLNREHQEGKIRKKVYADPGAELLRKLGLEHEQKHLSELKARGLKVVEISTDVLWTEAASATREAMVYGADVIYQATFVQGAWGGRADFLRRVEISSEIGAWSYEVVETKLAKSTKARALIQLCFYSELVAAIQGRVRCLVDERLSAVDRVDWRLRLITPSFPYRDHQDLERRSPVPT